MHVALALLLARCDGPHRVDGRPSLYAWARNTTTISRVAEFGVWRGGNAAKLLTILNPSRLVLVDAWQCLATMDPHVQRYYKHAGAREKQLQDSPVASLLGKRGKHTNAGAVSE